MNRIWHYLAIPLIAALLLWRISGAFQSGSETTYPTKPVHVVVPYGAGGGTSETVATHQTHIRPADRQDAGATKRCR